ncbi:synaptonemal complex protein 1 isoform X6 [Acanthopagrus latus]|uniref:synaptonemal complex protein 1 isoform X6 n=1 Tax=Acanthopagrus latus TaxID=8177 RepID=UPI00187C539D|nr:synaptonemal complex protein 1 isoform X6 [Acanthopagrus latus]
MDRDRGFNFKLLVPPRVNNGQVSAVRPQEIIESCGDFMNKLQQGNSKCYDKEQSMPFPNMSMVVPTKPTRQEFPKMKVVPPMEKDMNNCNPGQLYCKLFDEVEKIKCWKVKADSDTVHKERRLQENKRTIETQRKAIQELQFGNESLSLKLEEQISENEDLRNKNNATRNLCNILKDTFERSSKKMHLFESEREETHHILMENSESIQKLIAAFESLRMRAEADQQEMQKVKEDLLQFESLKEKHHQEYNMKEREVAVLQTKLKDKESELQKLLLDLHETQKHCKQLQEETEEQYELLKSLKTERESVLQELHTTEQCCKETEKKHDAIAAMLEKSKEEYAQMIKSKDLNLEELRKVRNQQAEKLEQIQTTIQELQNSLAFETQRASELEDKLVANDMDLKKSSTSLEVTMEQSAKKDGKIKILEDELDKKSKSIESMKGKIDVTEVRVEELTAELLKKTEEVQLLKTEAEAAFAESDELKKACEAAEKAHEDLKQKTKVTEESEDKAAKLTTEIQRVEEENQCLREELNSIKTEIQRETPQNKLEDHCEHLQEEIIGKEKEIKALATKLCNVRKNFEIKLKAQEEYKKENKMLKKQIAKETAKFSQLENEVNGLQEESQKLRRLNKEDYLKFQRELESKSTFAEELKNEVQKLKVTAAEAVKNKEDAELKCQHKIADMVALMEKHKSQYDRMVEQKDAELDENRKKEREAVACRKSLEVDLEKHKTDKDQLKQQLKTEVAEKENLQKELTDLKNEMSSMKSSQLSEVINKQSPASNYKQGKSSVTPKESSAKRHVFSFSKTRKTPSYSKDDGNAAVMKKADSDCDFIKTSARTTPKTKKIQNGNPETPSIMTNRVGGTSKIKSYRIRTPPSSLTACWEKNTIELDPRSDSSDQNDILSFAHAPAPKSSAPTSKLNSLQNIQSPVSHKSPGNSLKLAAMKRMRDAGWTAVTGCDKKKKKSSERVFA